MPAKCNALDLQVRSKDWDLAVDWRSVLLDPPAAQECVATLFDQGI